MGKPQEALDGLPVSGSTAQAKCTNRVDRLARLMGTECEGKADNFGSLKSTEQSAIVTECCKYRVELGGKESEAALAEIPGGNPGADGVTSCPILKRHWDNVRNNAQSKQCSNAEQIQSAF